VIAKPMKRCGCRQGIGHRRECAKYRAPVAKPRTATLKRGKRLKQDPNGLRDEARVFHDAVWALYGPRCWFFAICGDVRPAVDAAHIIPKSALGKHRYADPRLARPAHRLCHERYGPQVRQWPLADRIVAAEAANLYVRKKFVVPSA